MERCMERVVQISIAFALGAIITSMAPSFTPGWIGMSNVQSPDDTLISGVSTPVRYPLPGYAAGLSMFRN